MSDRIEHGDERRPTFKYSLQLSRYFVDCMICISHEPDEEFCAIEHSALALTPSVPAPEGSMCVFKV